jgi:filamentous hemagglutinin family protein
VALSVSIAALISLVLPDAAVGRDILRSGAPMSAPKPRTGSGGKTAASAGQISGNSRDALARTTRALQGAKAAQEAARKAAIRGPANLGFNPNDILRGAAGNPARLPNVPNGLAPGGLQVDPRVPADLANPEAGEDGSLWTGAQLPTQKQAGGRTIVTIKQTAQQALLNWETFNIGKETTLKFSHNGGSKWIAFNKVNDPSGVPSQILGSIRSPGQVYVINRNGIIFGGSSQINVRGLVASTLPINPNLIQRGLLNNPDAEFLFSALPTGSFTPEALPEGARYGDVIVQKGAQLTSPSDEAKVGGRIVLVGANVWNSGTISTPDGQTILAAGLQVGFVGHSAEDPSLRGLDAFVGAVRIGEEERYAGTAVNHGVIEAIRGNTTITGREVKQNGTIFSTTSVSLNGRVDLLASYDAVSKPVSVGGAAQGATFLYRSTGSITMGDASTIAILPEIGSDDKVVGTVLALRSQVNASGKVIHAGEGSTLVAPNAKVEFLGGEWRFVAGSSAGANTSTFVRSSGQIYLDRNVLIDVGGSVAVPVEMTQNLLTVELRSSELANSPLQRAGLLRNAAITVDLRNAGTYGGFAWVGTPLANLSGYLGLVERSVGELTVKGGDVRLAAGGSLVMQAGATINVSGGFIDFQGGQIQTSRLLYNGRLIDIRNATPDRIYDGIFDAKSVFTSARWGVTQVFDLPLAPTGAHFEEGYTQGAAGGSIELQAPSMALDGRLLGQTVATGARSRAVPVTASSLKISFLAQDISFTARPPISPTPPNVVFELGGAQRAAGAFEVDAEGNPAPLDAERVAKVILSPALLGENAFGSLAVENNDGNIRVGRGIELAAPAGGGIALNGSNITIGGRVTAPGGNIAMVANNIPLPILNQFADNSNQPLPDPISGRGELRLQAGAILSTAGLLVDDRLEFAGGEVQPMRISGGTLSLRGYRTILEASSVLDVSGGAAISATGSISYGAGGALTIAGGRDVNLAGVLGGRLVLNSAMQGMSGSIGGALSILAPAIQVGGASAQRDVWVVQPGFFDQGGFASFSLSGIGLETAEAGQFIPGLKIAAGTRIAPTAMGWMAVPLPPDGGGLQLMPVMRPEGLRSPVSLAFGATGASDFRGVIVRGDVVMGRNVVIQTDAAAAVDFTGQTVTLRGSVFAPGGRISVQGDNQFRENNSDQPLFPLATVHIAGGVVLSTAGKAVTRENSLGLVQGQVFGGGSIAVSGNIVIERGALFDVSGSRGTLDLAPGFSSMEMEPQFGFQGAQMMPVAIETNGGTISLSGGQMLYSDATLIGRAGGASAIGGFVTVSSGVFVSPRSLSTTADASLVIRQSGSTLSGVTGPIGIGLPLVTGDGSILPGIGNFRIDRFAKGGFQSLTLNGNVRFEGDVEVNARGSIRVASGGVVYAEGDVTLAAPYVALGRAFVPPLLPQDQTAPLFTQTPFPGQPPAPLAFAPAFGTGTLTVKADLIDVGLLTLQGVGKARLLAPTGDIRGNSTLNIAGDLVMNAGQIYPTTLGAFSIFAYDYSVDGAAQAGTVTIRGGVSRNLPLSGGGTLSIFASEIVQGGTLRAPIGVINLGWDGTGAAPVNVIAGSTVAAPITNELTLGKGSVTSVSAIDPLTGRGVMIPFGVSLDGNSWIDPSGRDITVGGVPEKAVNLAAKALATEAGSVIDIRGGGEFYAYRWIEGAGGTSDILASNSVFAVIPGYQFDYAPFAPFNPNLSSAAVLGGQPGYVNSTLRAGDRITVGGSPGLAAGTYTLLPARYALLPGAVLINPMSGTPVGTHSMADGAFVVSGYRSNDLDPNRTGITRVARFEVVPSEVMRQRAEYQDFFANAFLRESAIAREAEIPRLPGDSGYLALTASTAMVLQGDVLSPSLTGGRGSLVDINSPVDILINRTGTGGPEGTLVLSAGQLNRFKAESLLVGGRREFGVDGVRVAVNTGNLTLDNAGTPLAGTDIILVAKGELTLAEGAEIRGTNSAAQLDAITIGNAGVAGSGDGTLIRVSGSTNAPVARAGVGTSTLPALTIGPGSIIEGGAVSLDSTYATSLDSTAQILAKTASLSSGQITVLLENPGEVQATVGLVLSGEALESLQARATRLSLLSYSTFDVYGAGSVGSGQLNQFSIRSGAIRGFNQAGGTATFVASNLLIDNFANRTPVAGPAGPLDGTLAFTADEIRLGVNGVRVENFAAVEFNAADRVIAAGRGSFATAGSLVLNTPVVTSARASAHSLTAGGELAVNRPSEAGNGVQGGLGAELTLRGTSVAINSDVLLPSGVVRMEATSGDVRIGNLSNALVDVGGTARQFIDVVRYTSGGSIVLRSDTGSVNIDSAGTVRVAAHPEGGDAGRLSIAAPSGEFNLAGTIDGSASSSGKKGEFQLDAASIGGGSLAAIDAALNAGQFTQLREYRIRTGDVLVDGVANSRVYRVAADAGSILVSGRVDASGATGGQIAMLAHGSLVLQAGAVLDVSAQRFDSAGKGGHIGLEAGSHRSGVIDTGAVLDLQAGSTLDLSVAADSAQAGRFSGTLHLRAPRNAAQTDLAVAPISSTILGASSILVEGYRIYDLTGSGTIAPDVRTQIRNDATTFLGAAGSTTANYTNMVTRLLGSDPQGLLPVFVLAPGAEIINPTGDLVLGTSGSTSTSDWNLQTFRFGEKSAPGVLTLRASGNLTFFNTLSDGFAAVTPSTSNGNSSMWLAPLMAPNALLPVNTQSWSYRLTAGADLSGADFRAVQSLAALGANAGSVQIGKNAGVAGASGAANATTASLINNFYQVVRTGSGSIAVHAGRNVQLLNPFAAIYTAGTRVASATTVFTPNDFVVPNTTPTPHPGQGVDLGGVQQAYAPQYSLAGGNITILAANDIQRLTRDSAGQLLPDSSRQLPNNYVYRRGYVDPLTGEFGATGVGTGFGSINDPVSSTTWWVDFSNFFQSVGTLGGGNISMVAGRDVANVDAVAATNARMPAGRPDASRMLELGGGDISIRAGRNVDAGIYYVERGAGRIEAGANIVTNSTRSPSLNYLANFSTPQVLDSRTWLPTTLFVGKASFDIDARGDVLIGPTANAMLLPIGLNNKFWYKSYFSTYGSESAVRVSSLGGSVTFRTDTTLPDASGTVIPILQAWTDRTNRLRPSTAANFQPWIRLGETNVAPFRDALSLLPPNFEITAFSGDVNIAGRSAMAPAANGTLSLFASGAIHALQPVGVQTSAGRSTTVWRAGAINVSDANPAALPGITNPFAYFSIVGRNTSQAFTTRASFLDTVLSPLVETGATTGGIEEKQRRHAPGLLHLNDPNPVRLYALGGDLSGLTLFTPKFAQIYAARDISDVAFYIQNVTADSISTVTAGRDIIPSNASSPLRRAANAPGNLPGSQDGPLAGDIQISGPGTLVVAAGRDLDLGTGPSGAGGTGAGIVSIGNLRNPFLPLDGASLVVAAGMGPISTLGDGIDLETFIEEVIESPEGAALLEEAAPGVDFDSLSDAEKQKVALDVFFLALRDAGRNFNDPASPGFQNYDSGFAAIDALFGSRPRSGEIRTQGRDIRTRSGGGISILAPGGGLTLANTVIGNPLTPPGIVTESGGTVNIFTDGSVDIGIGRIFTLRGGDMMIWSSSGDIAAGTSSRTVQAAPPTRVIIDPQSAVVETDLAGLATGGGIGVLATVEGVEPGDVDLIAPAGVIDAGDAGIRVSGNINLAATQILNASNIAVGGASTGAPSTPTASAPSIGGVSSASSATATASNTAAEATRQQTQSEPQDEAPSLITVEVVGYGGGSRATPEEDDQEEEERRRRLESAETAPEASTTTAP